MYSQEINRLIDRMEQAIGENQYCNECRRSFHSSSDGCSLCGSLNTTNLIEDTHDEEIVDEATYLKISLERFERFGICLVRNEDGTRLIPIFNHQSCPWPREKDKEK